MLRMLSLAVLLALVPCLAAQEAPKKKPAYLGVQIRLNEDKDIVIQFALPDSPAEKAGLKSGDLILKIDGARAADLPTAVKLIQSLEPGKKVKFLIHRDGKDKEIEVTPKALD